MGEFDTGDTFEGRTFKGYASEGFRKEGGVIRIKSGKKGAPGKVIYKKGSTNKNKQETTTKQQTTEIKTTTGEPATVTKKETSSYPSVRLATKYRADLTTEQAERIARQQPERRYIAVSGEDIERINRDFQKEGYTGKKLLEAINKGEVKINKDQEGTITISKEEETTTEQTNTTNEITPPQEALNYLNKNYFGVTDYFEELTASGIKDIGTGAANIYTKKKADANNIFLLAQGKIKTGIGFSGAVASSLIEPIAWTLSGVRRYNKGIPEEEATSGIYKAIEEKERSQNIAGALQLSVLSQGIKVTPAEAVPVKQFPQLEKEPFIYIKPFERPSRIPEMIINKDKVITISPSEPSIIRGIQPETRGTPSIAGGLYTDTGLQIDKIDFSKTLPSGKRIISVIPKQELKGVQSQLKPGAITEERSVYAPASSELPTKQEIETTLKRIYNLKLETSPISEAKPGVNPEQVLNVFRSEAEKQTTLTPPIKVTATKEPAQIPEEIVFIQEGRKKGFIIGNKKAQSSINPFTELEIDRSGNIYETSKGLTKEPFKPSLPATSTAPEERVNVIIPEATRREYNFNLGNKNIIEGVTSARIKITPFIEIDTGIRSLTDTGQETGSRGRTRTNAVSRLRTETEQIQTQEQQEQIIFNPVRLTTPQYQPPRQRPEPEPITPPGLPKIKYPGIKQKSKETTGFNVLVKSKGIFTKINTKPLNLKSALRLGSETVERTSAATFKITGPKTPGGIFTNAPKGFKKKGNLFIEEERRRINTAGELREISYKGSQSNKIKKLFGG